MNKIYSGVLMGIESELVTLEINIKPTNYGTIFNIIGMSSKTIQDSRKKIITILRNHGIKLENQEITINLAPGDIRKEGVAFDLPILIAILLNYKKIKYDVDFFNETLFLGEVLFDGTIRPVKGTLSLALCAKIHGKKRIVIPKNNVNEAALINGLEIIGISNLDEIIPNVITIKSININRSLSKTQKFEIDFSDIKGQGQAKRLMQISAAGWHHSILVGPPGAGKSMLAQRLITIMDPLIDNEIIECTKIYSASGNLKNDSLINLRPYRAPHHTISSSGLIGGGNPPTAGEISLSHNGVLFLDELTEFRRNSIEALRQPIESKHITITRNQQSIDLPASFLLVTALNPCPCGYLGDVNNKCTCSAQIILNYLNKLSGPLLDRIDLQLFIPALHIDQIQAQTGKEISSADLMEKIKVARSRQNKRLGIGKYNGLINNKQIDKYCVLSPEINDFFKKIYHKLNLSMRGYHKILKICRTIADLEDKEDIALEHVKEALLYRNLDNQLNKLK